jgi:kynureninase
MDELAFQPGLAAAREMDRQDSLAGFRKMFVHDEPGLIYLDGNSLGRLTIGAAERVRRTVETEWGRELIRSWNAGWFSAPARVGDKIGRLVGAGPGQVVVSDSTTVNLFKLVMAALALRPDRTGIVSDVLNFPSDLYVLQGCSHLLGDHHRLALVRSADGITPDLQELCEAIDGQTALVTLSHVVFKSGYLYDAAAVTERAHEKGALVLWDLSHSAGVVPVELDRWGVDLAVGCTYKYLNGGPGAPAFLYVRREIQEAAASPIWGWFGQSTPFAFDLDYAPVEGVARFLAGTPPILSLLAMESALEPVLEAGIDRIRRGSHISIRHPEGYRINRVLIEEMQVLPDFREPDNIRLGLSPLYTSYAEVWEAVDRIRQIVEGEHYLHYSTDRQTVT